MEWPPHIAGIEDGSNGFADGNPWLPTASSSSGSPSRQGEPINLGSSVEGQDNRNASLPANPLYHGSPELGSCPEASTSHAKPSNGHLNAEVTRPTLYRLTSHSLSGLLNGLDSLSLPNASQESLSTEDAGRDGGRRSLDELRRLSIKGKGRAIDGDTLSDDVLGRQSLHKSRPRGREALLHPVEEGDTLERLALLYGCTVAAIRSANKMWTKDPIYPRKTLYIPLDACKQVPSTEVEFVQKSGEDEIQVFARHNPSGLAPVSKNINGKHGSSHASGRTRSSSLRLEASAEMPRPLTPYRDLEPDSSMDSPFSSQRSSFSHSRQPSASSHFNYLSNTTSEYGGSDDGLGSHSSYRGAGTPANSSVLHSRSPDRPTAQGMVTVPGDSSANAAAPQKTLQIVQIPGTNATKSSLTSSNPTRLPGRSPLISVDNLEETTSLLPLHDSVVSVSSTSLGTSGPSNDRLSALSGAPTNLRLRPRSPLDMETASESSLSDGARLSTRPASRSRKNSKEGVKTGALPSKSNNHQTLRLPGSLGKYISSAGAGLVSSLMGDKNASKTGWLATSELETEMQMAREYQSRQQQRTSISSDRTLHSRSRSSVSLRNQQPPNGAMSRRAPSLSARRPSGSDEYVGI